VRDKFEVVLILRHKTAPSDRDAVAGPEEAESHTVHELILRATGPGGGVPGTPLTGSFLGGGDDEA